MFTACRASGLLVRLSLAGVAARFVEANMLTCHSFGTPWRRAMVAVLAAISLLAGPLAPAAFALDAPLLLAPDEDIVATVDNNPPQALPEFHWAPVSGAQTYRLQISPHIGFATTAVNITTANNRDTPSSVALLPEGHWYWRVRVETPSPAGDYGEVRAFDKQWA